MRLIDAEALETKIKKIEAEALEHGFAPEYVAVDILLNFLNGAPTIEAKPIVHAHWENGECTNCKAFITDKNALLTPYCPFCGEQMDEEVNNNGTE